MSNGDTSKVREHEHSLASSRVGTMTRKEVSVSAWMNFNYSVKSKL